MRAEATRAEIVNACLNCGAELHGAFCSACGQRVIPAYPTVREMALTAAWLREYIR